MATIRQERIGQLIQKELSTIFQKMGFNNKNGGLVTITQVNMTPDLLIARVFLSIFNAKNPPSVLEEIEEQKSEVRHQLGNTIRNQIHRIPDLEFRIDDTLDHVFKMEELFKKIKGK
jgi:ribosome-binding factor A